MLCYLLLVLTGLGLVVWFLSVVLLHHLIMHFLSGFSSVSHYRIFIYGGLEVS